MLATVSLSSFNPKFLKIHFFETFSHRKIDSQDIIYILTITLQLKDKERAFVESKIERTIHRN